MTDQILSDEGFRWFLTILTGGLAGSWAVYDTISLIRIRGKDRTPVNGDRRFGYVIGIVIGVIGVWGCLRFHGVV